tara:strand:- start:2230 stop:2631 length:402 start_codon:yes stop_codon:yes gene_type:complete
MAYRTEAKLFQDGDFTSHAGLPLKWKLECDAIHPSEWRTIAKMIMDYQIGPFYKAEGIPRGGVALGDALNEYASGNPKDPILIADDVYTTGTSFREYIDTFHKDKFVYKWCVFARKQTDNEVKALFTMPEPRK